MRVAVAGLVAAALVAVLLLGGGPPTLEVDGAPAFRIETPDGVTRATARGDERLRLRDGRATLSVRPLTLPDYEGDVAGLLPVWATNNLPRARAEGRARIGGAPGYQVRSAAGTDVVLVPDEAGATRGVRLTLRGRSRALRSALRSFEFR